MIITISGIAGSGKSTVAKLLAKKLGYDHYSVGDIMRQIAQERGVSLLDLSKEAETSREIDEELDRRQKALSEKDNFVIDSRLGFHFLPESKKIFLGVSIQEAAKRICGEKREHEQYSDVNESIEKIKERITSEEKRYGEYYSVDYKDESHYDIVIDTTGISAQDVCAQILQAINL